MHCDPVIVNFQVYEIDRDWVPVIPIQAYDILRVIFVAMSVRVFRGEKGLLGMICKLPARSHET